MAAPAGVTASPASTGPARVRVFVDFWNFQLNIKRHLAPPPAPGAAAVNVPVDWRALGPWFATEASKLAAAVGNGHGTRFEGMTIYLSYDPRSQKDKGLKNWALNTLDRFPGVQVVVAERKPKYPPACPTCHVSVAKCPACSASMAGTVEKGVDTAIVTDMIRMAWADSYDLAVLVSSDRDFIPAVEFLDGKGHKVVQAGFPPLGSELARACWASFDILKAGLPMRLVPAP